MILRLVFDNTFDDSDLRFLKNDRCPHSCPSVTVERDLAAVVAGWPRMSPERKRCLVELASRKTAGWPEA